MKAAVMMTNGVSITKTPLMILLKIGIHGCTRRKNEMMNEIMATANFQRWAALGENCGSEGDVSVGIVLAGIVYCTILLGSAVRCGIGGVT